LQSLDIAFPIVGDSYRAEYGFHRFIPLISSPGTMILVENTWKPSTIAGSLVNRDILVTLLALCSLTVVVGILVWLTDRSHRKSNFPMDFRNGAGELVSVSLSVSSLKLNCHLRLICLQFFSYSLLFSGTLPHSVFQSMSLNSFCILLVL
jgi:hypothetical protein